MSVRQAWKRKTPLQKSSPACHNDSPPPPPRNTPHSISPPMDYPQRDRIINQLHTVSTSIDSHTPTPPSSPHPLVQPPTNAQVECHASFCHCCSKSFSLTLEEFGQILKIPFKGQASHTDIWSLDHLSIGVPSKGRYKTTPPSPNVVKSFIQVPRQGQTTRTKNKKTIVVGGHKDHASACLCHMLYCIETSTPYNLAFFILKRMEKTRNKPKELLPFRMLLTRLFKHVTRLDQGKKIPREPNASSSSTTLNHLSSSHPEEDIVEINDEESFHSNFSSHSQNVSSSSNVVHGVRQNPPHEIHNLNTYLSETINIQTQQREAHREGLRSIGQAIKNMMSGK
ncbi:hypothetical protein Tco_1473722 [Tanacetum coccineum]